jgi:hypothetical protein
MFSRGSKGGRGRAPGGFCRRLGVGKGLGFWGRGGIGRRRGVGLLQVSWTEEEGDPTGGVHLSVGERGAAGTVSGKAEMGRGRIRGWAVSVPPACFPIFFVL